MPAAAAAVGAFFSGLAATSVGTFLTTTIAGQLLVSVATSALLSAIAPKPDIKTPGIKSQFAQTGADNPLSFPVGTFATPGTRLAPWLSHGRAGGTPNAYLTLPVAISAAPGAALKRVHINDEWVTLGTSPHEDYGLPVQGKFQDRAWIKYYDGSQTVADPMMLEKYGPPRANPWSAQMVGTGMCIAYCTFRFDRELFNGLPAVVFETSGIPLYDPRRDSSAGGAGDHRWTDRSTWEPSDNPEVQIYNVARGITLFTGDVWGGGFDADRLPFANWAAAMNACDVLIDGVPQYRSGYQIEVSQKPSSIMEELGKACGAKFAESAGTLRTRVGPAALPVMMITDDDFLINRQQTEMPFPSSKSIYNGARATYPEPDSVYKAEDAPVYTSATLEAEDNGRRNLASLQFGSVPYVDQVQRLTYSYVEANRRFRRHAGSLQGAAALLEPLDTIAWTSQRHGYDAKIFSVPEIAADLRACLGRVSLLEEDPDDWDVPDGIVLPTAPAAPVDPPPDLQGVPGWALTADAVTDGTGNARRVRLKMSWNTVDLVDVRGIIWEIRNAATGEIVANGTTHDFTAGYKFYDGALLSDTVYEARGELLVDRRTAKSDWVSAKTGQVLLSFTDLDPSILTYIEELTGRSLTLLELENINIIEQDDQHPGWTGQVTNDPDGPIGAINTEVKAGHLYIDAGVNGQSILYNDAAPFDLGAIYLVWIKSGAGAEFWDRSETWAAGRGWASNRSWAGDIAGCGYVAEIATTQDDPADPAAVWSAWAPPAPIMVKVRGVRSRIRLTFGRATHSARLTFATTVIDVPDRSVDVRDLTIPAAGLDYTFDPAFRDTPVVVATMIGPSDGERLIVSNETADGVRLQIVNSGGTGVAGIVNISAKGYGRKEIT